jgi:DNA adenine methylase
VKPFLRWIGGKRKLVDEIAPWLPYGGQYHEPFLGSGALFFARKPLFAFLTDSNTMLTRTFTAVRHEVDAVIAALKIYAAAYAEHGAPFYTHVRSHLSEDMESPELAAAFIFLNKTNFQGIWRVNSDGKYNVPSGTFSSPPTICDEPTLRECSKALAPATIVNCDFREVERRAQPGDSCYMDPPYVPASATSNFTAYTKEKFGPNEQKALRDLALRLKTRGVRVVLSNSDTQLVRELYAGWELKEISRSGTISSNAEGRQAVKELLIR